MIELLILFIIVPLGFTVGYLLGLICYFILVSPLPSVKPSTALVIFLALCLFVMYSITLLKPDPPPPYIDFGAYSHALQIGNVIGTK